MSTQGSESGDASLVARAVAGERAALRALHDAHRPAVHRILRAFGDFDGDEVEDVVQETFVRAFRNLGRLERRDRFRAWLLTIARNCALTRLARRQSERDGAADLSRELEAQGLSAAALPDLEAGREVELVRRIVDELPDGVEKETVRLFYLEGNLSAREIAGRFGVGKSAITMRLERFRAKVRRRILAEVAALRGDESDE